MLGRAERLSTRGIARLAGVSVGTLYQYFPAKEAAVAAVIDKRISEDIARLDVAFENMKGRSLEDALKTVIEMWVPSSRWERALYPHMVDVLESLQRQEAVQSVISRFEARLAEELRQRREELRPELDPAIAATVTIHSQRATLFALSRHQPEMEREEIIEQLLRLGLGYLQGRASDKGAQGEDDPGSEERRTARGH